MAQAGANAVPPSPLSPRSSLDMAMVAGEASSDLLASLLLQGVRQHWPQTAIHAHGIGGSHMQAQGFEAQWPSERLAVHGYNWEVFKRVAGLLRIRRTLGNQLLHQRPDVFIGVDAPDFNLGLEQRLRQHGIKTVHFVCPSIWAWRPERVHAIRQAASHVLCLFPFEPALLAEHGIAATFVGHPLANVIPLQPNAAAARRQLQLREDVPVLAILPGSRSSEVQYLLPRFLHAVQWLLNKIPELQIVLPAVPAREASLRQQLQASGLTGRVHLLQGQSHLALQACDVTLIASGTATLEAALFKRPMVISYAMHPASAWWMRRKQMQPWIGLPNIMFRDFVVPELLQDAATPEALGQAVLDWLGEDATAQQRRSTLQRQFTELHQSLQADTAHAAAQAIEKVLSHDAPL